MKLLMQTDEDCGICGGKGTAQIVPYAQNAQGSIKPECERCMGTGKRLEWIKIVCKGISIYLIDG